MKQEVTINERFVKISHFKKDWIPLIAPLEIDQEVTLKITGQVSGYELETQNDGTVNQVFVVKGLLAEDCKLI